MASATAEIASSPGSAVETPRSALADEDDEEEEEEEGAAASELPFAPPAAAAVAGAATAEEEDEEAADPSPAPEGEDALSRASLDHVMFQTGSPVAASTARTR